TQADFDAVRTRLQRYRDELATTKLTLEGRESLLAAEQAALADAAQAVRAADTQREAALALVQQLTPAAEAAREALDSARPASVSAARREDFITRARSASREPLNELQTREVIDRQLAEAGWLVQDEAKANLYAGRGVALREVGLANGRADYLLYVDRQ